MARSEKLLVLSADHKLVGDICIACQKKLNAGDEVVVCPRCKSPHHADCWREAAGCRQHGCPQVALAVQSEPRENLGDARYLKRSPQRTALIIISVVLVLGLVGFALRPGPDPAAGRTKISIMVPGGIPESAYFDPIVEEFNASHPEHYLSIAVTPSVAYDQKLVVLMGARDAPDVFSLFEDRYLMFAEHGGLLDLTPYLESRPDLIDSFFPNGLEALQVDGSIYGIPHPGRNEILAIWFASSHPDLAWEILVALLEKMAEDWPEELKYELQTEPWKMQMPGF